VTSPGSTGVLPDDHPQNMHVGGSKGSISGNFAMENAALAIVIGSRGVCQADCSGIGYKSARAVININADLVRCAALQQDAGAAGRYHRGVRASCEAVEAATALESTRRLARPSARPRRPSGPPTSRPASTPARCMTTTWQRPVLIPAGGDQDRGRFRQAHRGGKVLRCRRRPGQRLPDRRGRPHRRHLYRGRRLLHGLCGQRAARLRAGRRSRATASRSAATAPS
jgi:hypothetical protein